MLGCKRKKKKSPNLRVRGEGEVRTIQKKIKPQHSVNSANIRKALKS